MSGEKRIQPTAAQSFGGFQTLSCSLSERSKTRSIRLEVSGVRSQVVGFVTTVLQPQLFSDVVVRDGISSFGHLLDTPIEHRAAPELFCLYLYRDFDIDRLVAIGAPVRISNR